MISYRSDVLINRPPAVVFEYLVDTSKQALWSGVPMKQLTSGPLTTGSRMEVRFGMGPLKANVGLQLTAVEPARRFAFKSFSGPIGWNGQYVLEPDGSGGTKLSQEGTLQFKGLWRLIQPIVGAEISRGEVKELEKMKAVIEKA